MAAEDEDRSARPDVSSYVLRAMMTEVREKKTEARPRDQAASSVRGSSTRREPLTKNSRTSRSASV